MNYAEYERTTKAIRESLRNWAKIQADSNYDKTGIGLNRDSRFRTATITFSIDSWAGVYGSSGCSTVLSVGNQELFAKFFIQEINRDLIGILGRVAGAIEAASSESKQAEISQLKQRLAELETAVA